MGKVPGRKDETVKFEFSVFNDENRRDMPIKFNQGAFGAFEKGECVSMQFGPDSAGLFENEHLLFPMLKVPKCGAAFDFFPFPANGYDEGETLIYVKSINGLPSQRKIVNYLDKGIIRVTFTKLQDGAERVLYGTTR